MRCILWYSNDIHVVFLIFICRKRKEKKKEKKEKKLERKKGRKSEVKNIFKSEKKKVKN